MKVIIEEDCGKVINILNNKKPHFDTYNWVREVRWWVQKIEDIPFTWIGKNDNKVADKLARQQLIPNQSSFCFFISYNYTRVFFRDTRGLYILICCI